MGLTLKSRRKFWFKIHLYLGLFAGMPFVLIGLTGSLLAFEHSLDEWLNSELMTVAASDIDAEFLPLDEIVAIGAKLLPPDGTLQSIGFPRHSGAAFELWFSQPSPGSEYSESHQIFINPYTGEVAGRRLKVDFSRGWRGPFMDVVLRLHYSLALGDYGMKSVGFIGLSLIFLVLTGLIAWWPSSGKFENALTFKRNSGFTRFNYDLHKTVGFYLSAVLLFLILSGVYLIFPDYGRGLISVCSPVAESYPLFRSVVSNKTNQSSLGLNQIKAITDARFPDGDYRFIGFPKDEQGVFVVGKREIGEPNERGAYRRLWIDQYSGKILHAQERRTQTAGDAFVAWLYPLHTGEAFGFIGKFFILLMGLVPFVLYLTGVIRWLQKRKAARLKSRNRMAKR